MDAKERCPYCGQAAGRVYVHGHEQCLACGLNIDECCRGEQASDGGDEGR
ncbi:MAG TPA: hypothetical protein VL181_07135 [Holophagaceae bacterium]|nr:hypothetical protein [Holophagaceae bacterium]